MSADSPIGEWTVAAMREEFDGAFARPRLTGAQEAEDILAVRLGPEPYALRLSDVAGVHLRRRVVRVPSERTSFVGIAAIRSSLVAVYDLGVLLGASAAGIGRDSPPPALVLARARLAVGLAVSSVDGCVRAKRADLPAKPPAQGAGSPLIGALHVGATLTPLVDLACVLETLVRGLEGRARSTGSRKDP